MTVDELMDRMSSAEFLEWMAYDMWRMDAAKKGAPDGEHDSGLLHD